PPLDLGDRYHPRLVPYPSTSHHQSADSNDPWWMLFVFIASAWGFLFVIATPPFEAPDERAHFYRAFAVSGGHLVPTEYRGHVGNSLPTSVSGLAEQLSDDIPFHPERKTSALRIGSGFAIRVESRRQQFVPSPNTAFISFIPYLPQASGIAMSRLATDSVLALFYAGRIANLFAAILIFASAFPLTPLPKPLFFLL